MSDASKPHSELLRYWLSDAHSHADPKFLDRNQVIEDALALARELESTLEQYEGALATIETLESKEELSAIIRSQTEEIESLSEQYEVQRDKLVTLDAEYDRLKEQLEAAREQLAAPRDVTALRVGIDWHSHDGMVTVYDRDGRYMGCMGRESWDWLLKQGYEKCRASVEQLEAARDVLRGIAENGACASDSRVADEYLRSSTGAGGGDGHLPHHPYPAKRPT